MPTYKSIETYRGFVYPWSMDHVGHMREVVAGTLIHISTELVGVYFDTTARESIELPEFVREKAAALTATTEN